MSAHRSARRRLVVVTAVLSVLVTLFPAVGSALVSEACPSTVPSSQYRDLSGLSADAIDAIDCITHYGIAQGATSTRFDPFGIVTRWQMALFLARTAEDLGITLPTVTTQSFIDIAAYPIETQRAINQLGQLGITNGVGGGRFDPAAPATRWQMALFLTRLHQRAGSTLPDGRNQGFTDIAGYPVATQIAINQLAQLGVTTGTTTTTFGPGLLVPRWQMALFLARDLQVGRALPYLVTVAVQPTSAPTTDTVTVVVTVLTSAGRAVADRRVDVFAGSLDSGGRCVLDTDTHVGGGDAGTGTNCRIDSGDPRTNSSGKVTVLLTHDNVKETTRIHAWIGDNDQTFDSDQVRTFGFADVVWTAAPTAMVLPSKQVRFGTQTTVQGWLVDAQGAIVPTANQQIVVSVRRGGTQILAFTLLTDSSGRFTFSYTGPADPSASAPNDPIVDTVTAFWDRDKDGNDDGAAELDATATITWDDTEPRADVAVLTQNRVSTLVGQSTTLTATVTDKFGGGLAGAEVTFLVGGPNATDATVTTNSSGVATFSYSGTTAGVDTIDASVDVDGDDVADIPTSAVSDLTHYQVVSAPDLSGTRTFDILAFDGGANTLDVVDLGNGNGYRLTFDSNSDTYTVNGAAVSMSSFENTMGGLTLPALGNVIELKTMPYASSQSGASTFVLKTT